MLLGIYRLAFFRSAAVKNIQNIHRCCHVTCSTRKEIIHRSCVGYSGKLGSIHGISIRTNYIRWLSCSSKHYKDTEKDAKDALNEPPVKNGSSAAYYFKRLKFLLKVFTHGSMNLFSDIKLAWKTKRKLGSHPDQITREELVHMRQTTDDVKKTIPVLLLFWIPFIGYFIPVLAYLFPKQLLSEQFWHPEQKKKLMLEEYKKRSEYYLPLIKAAALTCEENEIKDSHKLCLHIMNGNHPSNADLLQFRDIVSKNERFWLQNMPRDHLVKLCACWLISTGRFVPRWYLMNAMGKRISRVHVDDMMILREGAKSLPPISIAKAIHVRGLDYSVLNEEEKLLWMEEWVQVSSQISAANIDDATSIAKLDFGAPDVNVQDGFYKLDLPDGDDGTYSGTFPCEHYTCTIKVSGYTHTKGKHAAVVNKYSNLSNLLRSSLLTDETGTMTVEISGLKPSTRYVMKSYHHSTCNPEEGVECSFVLQYEGNQPNLLEQSASGDSPDPPLMHMEAVRSSGRGNISFVMKSVHYDGGLNGLEIHTPGDNVSFLAHCAVFKAANFEKHAKENRIL